MNIHEFQAKALFTEYKIPCPKGSIAQTPEAISRALNELDEGVIVVKAQIHAGGRGKGHFKDGFQGGVKIAKDKAEATDFAQRMLGNTLITKQTGAMGKEVNTIYFNEPISIAKEYYLAITLDRSSSKPVIMVSTEGGMDIEKVAEETPERIHNVFIDPGLGLQTHQSRLLGFKLGFEGEVLKQFIKLLPRIYKLFWEKDSALLEINPLVLTKDNELMALDAKMSFDSNALFRHPEIVALRDISEEDPKEVEAGKYQLSYIALDGDIACLVNGAGLAMATMDIIKHFGGNPANFLDVGGGANTRQVTEAFHIILSDHKVKGILVNIFGGIMSCKTIAKGIIAAAQNVNIQVPLVVRLEGNEAETGKALLEESGLKLLSANTLSDAAQKIVQLLHSPAQA